MTAGKELPYRRYRLGLKGKTWQHEAEARRRKLGIIVVNRSEARTLLALRALGEATVPYLAHVLRLSEKCVGNHLRALLLERLVFTSEPSQIVSNREGRSLAVWQPT